jgi:hypothetical protein
MKTRSMPQGLVSQTFRLQNEKLRRLWKLIQVVCRAASIPAGHLPSGAFDKGGTTSDSGAIL